MWAPNITYSNNAATRNITTKFYEKRIAVVDFGMIYNINCYTDYMNLHTITSYIL